MKNIYFRDGILIYYGNPAGYLSEGKVVLDSIFDKEEIIAFLSEKEKLAVEIRSGVYDRLSEGGGMEMTVEASKGRVSVSGRSGNRNRTAGRDIRTADRKPCRIAGGGHAGYHA